MRSPSNKLFIWIVLLSILLGLGAISFVNENSEDKRKQHVFNSKASESEDWIFKRVKNLPSLTQLKVSVRARLRILPVAVRMNPF